MVDYKIVTCQMTTESQSWKFQNQMAQPNPGEYLIIQEKGLPSLPSALLDSGSLRSPLLLFITPLVIHGHAKLAYSTYISFFF